MREKHLKLCFAYKVLLNFNSRQDIHLMMFKNATKQIVTHRAKCLNKWHPVTFIRMHLDICIFVYSSYIIWGFSLSMALALAFTLVQLLTDLHMQ
jgi:hypothetical protein